MVIHAFRLAETRASLQTTKWQPLDVEGSSQYEKLLSGDKKKIRFDDPLNRQKGRVWKVVKVLDDSVLMYCKVTDLWFELGRA